MTHSERVLIGTILGGAIGFLAIIALRFALSTLRSFTFRRSWWMSNDGYKSGQRAARINSVF